jgi:hypothetical protein
LFGELLQQMTTEANSIAFFFIPDEEKETKTEKHIHIL